MALLTLLEGKMTLLLFDFRMESWLLDLVMCWFMRGFGDFVWSISFGIVHGVES
jgi:hypothetical protein